MNIKALKYQASCFGSPAIDPTPDNIKKSVDAFMGIGYLPASVQEVDHLGSSAQRLSVQSATAGMLMNFITNRVDVLKQIGFPGVTDGGDVDVFVSSALTGLEKAESEFRQQYNRVSLVGDYIAKDISAEALVGLRKTFLPAVPWADEVEPYEWDAKWAVQIPLDEINEMVNLIVNIGRHTLQEMDQSGVRVSETLVWQVDINTLVEKAEYRCDQSYREKFFRGAVRQLNIINERVQGYLQ